MHKYSKDFKIIICLVNFKYYRYWLIFNFKFNFTYHLVIIIPMDMRRLGKAVGGMQNVWVHVPHPGNVL